MSNRQERRRRHTIVRDGDTTHLLASTGQETYVGGDQMRKILERDPLEGVAPDEHVWAMFLMYRVDVNTVFDGQHHLDTENLITMTGPGCYRCEQVYTLEIAAKPCPGDPS